MFPSNTGIYLFQFFWRNNTKQKIYSILKSMGWILRTPRSCLLMVRYGDLKIPEMNTMKLDMLGLDMQMVV